MNTPAHVIINLFALGRNARPSHQIAVAAGAVLPDIPMFLFYFVEKVLRDVPEHVIWTSRYYSQSWQNFIDCFNSLPFIAGGLVLAVKAGSRTGVLLFSSMVLHVCADFPLHHDDAHRHFFPVSDWRFQSPVSYWDPQHYGSYMAGVEILVVLVCSWLLFRWSEFPLTRWLVGVVGMSYAIFFGYVVWVWV